MGPKLTLVGKLFPRLSEAKRRRLARVESVELRTLTFDMIRGDQGRHLICLL